MTDSNADLTETLSISQEESTEDEQCFPTENQSLSCQGSSRLENLLKISQKKQTLLAQPIARKLLKLAIYSKCQVLTLIFFNKQYLILTFRVKTVNV